MCVSVCKPAAMPGLFVCIYLVQIPVLYTFHFGIACVLALLHRPRDVLPPSSWPNRTTCVIVVTVRGFCYRREGIDNMRS